MTQEQLFAKGVEKSFDGQEVWFSVESLEKHYSGIQYHSEDIVEGLIKFSDIFGDAIQEIEVSPTIEVVVTQETLDISPQLVAEGIEVGEILTVDAIEDIPVSELPDSTPEELPVWINPTVAEETPVVSEEEIKPIVTE